MEGQAGAPPPPPDPRRVLAEGSGRPPGAPSAGAEPPDGDGWRPTLGNLLLAALALGLGIALALVIAAGPKKVTRTDTTTSVSVTTPTTTVTATSGAVPPGHAKQPTNKEPGG